MTAQDNAQSAIRTINEASANMQHAVDTIKSNGNHVSDQLLASMLATHEAISDLARGLLEVVAA